MFFDPFILIDRKFLKANFPKIRLQSLVSNLQLSCTSAIVEINSRVNLNMLFKAGFDFLMPVCIILNLNVIKALMKNAETGDFSWKSPELPQMVKMT